MDDPLLDDRVMEPLRGRIIRAPDAGAFGKLYVSPISLAASEQDAGATNRSTVRLEGHAAFGTERVAAACRIAAS